MPVNAVPFDERYVTTDSERTTYWVELESRVLDHRSPAVESFLFLDETFRAVDAWAREQIEAGQGRASVCLLLDSRRQLGVEPPFEADDLHALLLVEYRHPPEPTP